jgi:hypothetical protein
MGCSPGPWPLLPQLQRTQLGSCLVAVNLDEPCGINLQAPLFPFSNFFLFVKPLEYEMAQFV